MKVEDSQKRRGMKRKRFEPPKEKDLGTKVAGKLHHDLKEVRKAAKKVKALEFQKLFKKLKGLRLKSDPSVADCELQLEELKHINHEAVANTALRSKLTKDKILSDNESMQTALSKELTDNLLELANHGTPAAKIQSRLLSSKILASEVTAVVEDLRSVINPVTTDYSQDGDISAELDESMPERPRKLKKLDMKDIPEDEDVEMDFGEEEIAEAGEDEEIDPDEWESGTVGDDEKEPENGWDSRSIAGESDYDMDEDPPSDSEEVNEKPSAKSGPSKSASGQSTFLPSLSTGFIRGSDSDWSDKDEQAAEIDQKKNRRGQRARRAIWEKKYGRNANHKKKEVAEAERGKKRVNNRSDHSSNKVGGSRRPQADEVPAQSKRGSGTSAAQDSRPLHPSWEAKRRLNERQSAAIVPATGRKIKFS